MFKLINEWDIITEMNIINLMGRKIVKKLLTIDESKFVKQMIGVLDLLSLSEEEVKALERSVTSGNRIYIYHIVLHILFRSLIVENETQRLEADQEDIEQHGLFDESDHSTLIGQISFNNICNSCPLINEMDLQDISHFFLSN